MKTFAHRITFAALLGIVAILAGCGLPSVYPFYTEKDVIFDPALVGVWGNATSNATERTTFEKSGDHEYKVTDINGQNTNTYTAHLFRLDNQLFLDCVSETPDQFIPAHMLLKVDQIKPTLRFATLNEDWIDKLFEQEPNALRHWLNKDGGNSGIVLTADTAELQQFLRKYLNTKEAFSDPTSMQLQ